MFFSKIFSDIIAKKKTMGKSAETQKKLLLT